MATVTTTQRKSASDRGRLVEMVWDPITRIVGSLGLYTRDRLREEGGRRVLQHLVNFPRLQHLHERKGSTRRALHHQPDLRHLRRQSRDLFCYTQQMAYGVRPPALGEWIVNLGEAAEYMFDHNIFQENLVGVDFCEKMVRETNPGVWEKAQKAAGAGRAASRVSHDRRHHALAQPVRGRVLSRSARMSRMTREMFCLMEGRHVHPSTLYAGGVGTMATIQTFTDYLVRLMKYVEFMKKVVPMHDDLFNFFYEALPGYEKVGQRRVLLGCWGAFQDPEVCNFSLRDMTDWGRKMFVTPGVVVDGKLVTNDLVKINLGIRILLGSSYYDDWGDQKMYVTRDELGNPVDQRHPWNQHTIPRPQKRNFDTSTRG